MFKIHLLNDKIFECDPNDLIVSSALKQGVFLEHSCLSGRCSSCKVKVEKGDSEAVQEELTLTEAEKNNNYILACIRKPLSDLIINAEDLGEYGFQKPKTIPVKINGIANLTDDIIKVTLRYPPTQTFSYLPGQYIDLIKGPIKRSYSIANAPNQGVIELIIKNYEQGQMSNYWFNQAKINDLLRIEGPKGTFFLRKNSGKSNLVFLATGTGIAPVKAILEDENNLQELNKFENIYVLWGMKYSRDIFWETKITGLNIKFMAVLSREQASKSPKQYVQQMVLNQNIDFSNTVVYACGSNDMILEAQQNLKNRGLKDTDFYSDAFVISN